MFLFTDTSRGGTEASTTVYIFPLSTPDVPPECLVHVDLDFSALLRHHRLVCSQPKQPFRWERVGTTCLECSSTSRADNPATRSPRQLLPHTNMRSPPPEVVATWPRPNYINPETRGPDLIVAGLITLSVALICLALRLYVRVRIMRKTEMDDYVMVAATVSPRNLLLASVS